MPLLEDVLDVDLLQEMILKGYVQVQYHPSEAVQLAIYNYTKQAAYEGVWNDVTRQCRGLIVNVLTHEVVARPFPKFWNYGQEGAPVLSLDEPVVVTDKLDGSLGIYYDYQDGMTTYRGIATRGSFTSDQAIHASEVLETIYPFFRPQVGCTYLFEIIYRENRVVLNYGDVDDIILLDVLETDTGLRAHDSSLWGFDGTYVDDFEYEIFEHVLEAEPRQNAEGYVIYIPRLNERVKIKQEDYVALHRIVTGTNARNVWEYAAVQACKEIITEPKYYWATYLGIDPARADECLSIEDDWLTGVPDEFYEWVNELISGYTAEFNAHYAGGLNVARILAAIPDKQKRFELMREDPLQREILRVAEGRVGAENELKLRCWRHVTPEPTRPFVRDEAIA